VPPNLTVDVIEARLAALPGWTLRDGALERTWQLGDFSAALALIVRVGLLAEKHDHHPEIRNVYDRVDLRLWTHASGGITERDLALAAAISAL
jgi:4a-hydroxytetrahydrobiopterin dehydratase